MNATTHPDLFGTSLRWAKNADVSSAHSFYPTPFPHSAYSSPLVVFSSAVERLQLVEALFLVVIQDATRFGWPCVTRLVEPSQQDGNAISSLFPDAGRAVCLRSLQPYSA